MRQILVIDDDPNLLASLKRRFRRYRKEWELATARDGVEAMTLVRQKSFDLVITDILMPQQDGIETIVELRRSHPSIKVIAMSGGGRHVGENSLHQARTHGAHETLEKPFDPDTLVQAVRALLAPEPDRSLSSEETSP